MSDLNRSRNLALVVLLIGGISIGVMAYLMSKRMARKVARADAAKDIMNEQVIEAGKLASVGELPQVLPTKSTIRWQSWWKKPGGFRIYWKKD